MDGGDTPAAPLYTVLPERRAAGGAVGGAMMGSTHTYDVKKASQAMSGGTQSVSESRELKKCELH